MLRRGARAPSKCDHVLRKYTTAIDTISRQDGPCILQRQTCHRLVFFLHVHVGKMYTSTLLWVVSLLAVGYTSSSPSPRYVIHERRNVLPSGFESRERLDPTARIPLRIGLKQRNLHLASELLNQVSHPQSETYAKYWTSQEVVETFSPRYDTLDHFCFF